MGIFDMSPEELTAFSLILSTEIVKGLSIREQEVLGYFLESVGVNILLIANQRENINERCGE